MENTVLVTARRLTWDENAWRQPGLLALITRSLKKIAADDNTSTESRAEIEFLMKKLYAAGKRPPLA